MAGSKISPSSHRESATERRASALVLFLVRQTKTLERSFYDVGLALRELADGRLYRALGFQSLGGMLLAMKIVSRKEAAQLIAIVDHVPRRTASAVGYSQAAALAAAAARQSGVARPRPEKASSASTDRRRQAAPTKPSKGPVVLAEQRAASEAAALSRVLGRAFRRLGMTGAIGEAVRRTAMGWVVLVVLPLDSARALATKLET